MDKKQEILGLLAELNYHDLAEIETAVKAQKKTFKPFRIKRKFKRCGKDGCPCMDGPADNEWGNLHGPYLTAQWQEGGQTKTASLGREYSYDEIFAMGNGLPKWYEFVVSLKQYEKLSQDRQYEIYDRSLSDEDFEAHYGIAPMDDSVGRPRKLKYDRRAFNAKYDESKQGRAIRWSDWGKMGIGTFGGILILDDLVKRGFYFKE